MKRRRVKGVESPNKRAMSSSSSNKKDAQAQGFGGAGAAAAEAMKEDGGKAIWRGEGMVGGGGGGATVEVTEERMDVWEEWPWWWTSTWELADEEEMSFWSVWSPFWDGDFVGDEDYNSLFGDVAWDDDLWNLKDLEKPKA